MPILIMGLIALAAFIAIVGMVCFAGLAEEHELKRLEHLSGPNANPQAAAHRPAA